MRGVTTFTRQMPRFWTTVRTTGRDAGTSRQITVFGPVGLRVSRTRTGCPPRSRVERRRVEHLAAAEGDLGRLVVGHALDRARVGTRRGRPSSRPARRSRSRSRSRAARAEERRAVVGAVAADRRDAPGRVLREEAGDDRDDEAGAPPAAAAFVRASKNFAIAS